MSPRFEELRDWAIDRATDFALAPDGTDRLAVDGLAPAWSLRIEAFNLLMPLASACAPKRVDWFASSCPRRSSAPAWSVIPGA